MKRKGAFYINTFSPHLLNKNELYVLTLHEEIPGHHYENNYHINRDVLISLKVLIMIIIQKVGDYIVKV